MEKRHNDRALWQNKPTVCALILAFHRQICAIKPWRCSFHCWLQAEGRALSRGADRAQLAQIALSKGADRAQLAQIALSRGADRAQLTRIALSRGADRAQLTRIALSRGANRAQLARSSQTQT